MGKQLVVLDFWTVAKANIPRAFFYMGKHRRWLKREPNLAFWKLLGTGSGQSFTLKDSDPTLWAALTVWTDRAHYEEFKRGKVFADWSGIAKTTAHFELEPLAAKGQWQNQSPFVPEAVTKWTGLTVAITRARIKPRWWREFWRSIPPVSTDLNQTAGLITSVGIGEAPVGLQGTFSLWQSMDAITQFASRQQPHQKVVARTAQTGWYAEELFARFKVLSLSGSLGGVDLAGFQPASTDGEQND